MTKSTTTAPRGLVSTRQIVFGLFAVLASILFVRLGFWQLGRHAGAAETNERLAARLAEPPLRLDDVAGGAPGDVAGRRVRLIGTWETGGEVLIRGRTHEGRPGVHVVTPLRFDVGDGDTASVLVLRGWLPAPDAMRPGSVEPPEPLAASGVTGIARESRAGSGLPQLPVGEGADYRPSFAAIDVAAIGAATGDSPAYLPVFVQLVPDDGTPDPYVLGQAIRVPFAAPGPGPHLSYAIQWFSFALITLVGTSVLLRRERRPVGRVTAPPEDGVSSTGHL